MSTCRRKKLFAYSPALLNFAVGWIYIVQRKHDGISTWLLTNPVKKNKLLVALINWFLKPPVKFLKNDRPI